MQLDDRIEPIEDTPQRLFVRLAQRSVKQMQSKGLQLFGEPNDFQMIPAHGVSCLQCAQESCNGGIQDLLFGLGMRNKLMDQEDVRLPDTLSKRLCWSRADGIGYLWQEL